MRVPSRIFLLVFAALTVQADVRDCVCNLAAADVAQTRGCSLCIEVEKHPASEAMIVIRDNDPTKPNRWLVVPHAKYDGANPLVRMSADERVAMWNTAIAKGSDLWGDAWAVAMNGDTMRRQCHQHVHVGKLLAGNEKDDGYYVESAAGLPAIADGSGLWFHPVGERLHVHAGEQINETVLMR